MLVLFIELPHNFETRFRSTASTENTEIFEPYDRENNLFLFYFHQRRTVTNSTDTDHSGQKNRHTRRHTIRVKDPGPVVVRWKITSDCVPFWGDQRHPSTSHLLTRSRGSLPLAPDRQTFFNPIQSIFISGSKPIEQ